MSIVFSICIREAEIRVRKRRPPAARFFRNKKSYSRKLKHKGAAQYGAAPHFFLFRLCLSRWGNSYTTTWHH